MILQVLRAIASNNIVSAFEGAWWTNATDGNISELRAHKEVLREVRLRGGGSHSRLLHPTPHFYFFSLEGYEEEARIRDFYTAGADKIVFRKVLNAA